MPVRKMGRRDALPCVQRKLLHSNNSTGRKTRPPEIDLLHAKVPNGLEFLEHQRRAVRLACPASRCPSEKWAGGTRCPAFNASCCIRTTARAGRRAPPRLISCTPRSRTDWNSSSINVGQCVSPAPPVDARPKNGQAGRAALRSTQVAAFEQQHGPEDAPPRD